MGPMQGKETRASTPLASPKSPPARLPDPAIEIFSGCPLALLLRLCLAPSCDNKPRRAPLATGQRAAKASGKDRKREDSGERNDQ